MYHNYGASTKKTAHIHCFLYTRVYATDHGALDIDFHATRLSYIVAIFAQIGIKQCSAFQPIWALIATIYK